MIKRLIYIILLHGLCYSVAFATETGLNLKQEQDSLLKKLSETNEIDQKLKILEDLTFLTRQTPSEVYYLKQQLEITKDHFSQKHTYQAIESLVRYYSNENRLDSLQYWLNVIDSIARDRNEVPESLFSAHNALCRYYLINGFYELAMNEAVSQQILANKSRYKMGMIASEENIGLIYMLTKRYSESIPPLENCISNLKKLGNMPNYELQIIECLVKSYLYVNEFEKTEEMLNYYENILIKIENSPDIRWKSFPENETRCVLYSFRIQLYSMTNRLDKAYEAIQAIAPHKDAIQNYVVPIYNLAMSYYYYMKKDYNQVLDCVNKITGIEYKEDALHQKLLTMKAMNKKKEVLATYRQLLELEQQTNTTAYVRQVDQLRSLHNLNEQEKEAKILMTQQAKLKNRQSQLVNLIGFSVILLVIFIFLIYYLNRSKKLSNKLIKEKHSLNEINDKLWKSKEKAEKADKMKSNFIANISHEIYAPLNAIAGFVGLLKDAKRKDKSKYTEMINHNSNLLLNLVNDVLDLSRMETDDFKLNFELVNIQECCQHAPNTVSHRIAQNVKLKFIHPDSAFTTMTDPLHLEQLLVNLLINSAKFTDEGEISLDYKVNADAKKIIFTVTDTGCGVPLDKQNIIFNRFEKLNESKQGTGLGLSICMDIAERFNGSLSLDPTYNKGARFIFVLPYSD